MRPFRFGADTGQFTASQPSGLRFVPPNWAILLPQRGGYGGHQLLRRRPVFGWNRFVQLEANHTRNTGCLASGEVGSAHLIQAPSIARDQSMYRGHKFCLLEKGASLECISKNCEDRRGTSN